MYQSMCTAPRDGTVIEIEISAGFMPWYGIFQWDSNRHRWNKANGPSSLIESETHYKWRPYSGDTDNYVDPTGGAQNSYRYWGGTRDGAFGEPEPTVEDPPIKPWWKTIFS